MNWATATFLIVLTASAGLVVMSLIWARVAKRAVDKWDGKSGTSQ